MATTQKSKSPKQKTKANTKVRPKRRNTKSASAKLPVVHKRGGDKLRLRSQLQLTRPDFARLLNASERTIAGAESGERSAEKLQRTYRETERLVEALSEVVERDAIGPWLLVENEALDGLKPLEVIERGKIDLLWDMVHRLRYGMPS